MDFSKFRDSGDLSDLVVVVEGHENHLHRFPLFAKSDYFCGLARTPARPHSPSAASKSRVELKDFPGGQAVFSVVADFCYNMAPKVNKDNVVLVRCAAEVLQMSGPGNLAEAADRYLQDTLTSAKLSRAYSPLVSLLLQCVGVGQLAANCGVVDSCTEALVDTLLKSPSKFSPANSSAGGATGSAGSAFSPQGSAFTPMKPAQAVSSVLAATTASSSHGGDIADDGTMQKLCELPEAWFASLLKKALERGVAQSFLASAAVRYVSQAIDKAGLGGETNGGINGHSTPICEADVEVEAVQDVGDLDKDVDSMRAEMDGLSMSTECSLVSERRADLGPLLDRVLTTLPEEAYSMSSLTLEWMTKVLRIATTQGCSCRRFLVKIAADMLSHLQPEDLCLVSPSVLHDIVLEAKADDSQAQRACSLVDTYLAEMAKKGVLTADTFRLLANATPSDARRNHDNLYEVLEYVLKAGWMATYESKKDSLSNEQRQELLSTVNLDLVSEETLQRALDSALVSAEPVARAALNLCSRLRSELESVKYIAQMQEEELHKYQIRGTPQASPRVAAFTALKMDSDSGFSDNNQDTKTSSESASDHVRAAQSVLSTARTKLAMPLYSGHRPYLPSSAHSSAYPSGSLSTLEHDISLQDELEFRMDRSSFRSLEPRVRSRHLNSYGSHTTSSSGTSSHHPHRSTYFPYSPRF